VGGALQQNLKITAEHLLFYLSLRLRRDLLKVDARGGADDRSPLFLAALAKRWDVCAWLLEHGASKNIRDKKGLTAYQAMAGSSDPEVCLEIKTWQEEDITAMVCVTTLAKKSLFFRAHTEQDFEAALCS